MKPQHGVTCTAQHRQADRQQPRAQLVRLSYRCGGFLQSTADMVPSGVVRSRH